VLAGPTAMFPVFVTGALLMEFGGPSHRGLTQKEINFANQVFKDTIPWDRIVITDMVGAGGRPFTVPGMDGSIILNLGYGTYYSDASDGTVGNATTGTHSIHGYAFIHELTHAWEICHADFEAQGFLCSEAVIYADSIADDSLTNQYKYGSPEGSWSHDFNVEQRACIVADWFFGKWFYSGEHSDSDPRSPQDAADPYFRYIAGNIWLGAF
jgi:hypothetical protein